jgi:hypothetical protein
VVDELDHFANLGDVTIVAGERRGHEHDLTGAGVLEDDFASEDVDGDRRLYVLLGPFCGLDRVTETADVCHVWPF